MNYLLLILCFILVTGGSSNAKKKDQDLEKYFSVKGLTDMKTYDY